MKSYGEQNSDYDNENYLETEFLSPNPFPPFHFFTWRKIGEPISDRHFLYLSTLSRNSGNGFELRSKTIT